MESLSITSWISLLVQQEQGSSYHPSPPSYVSGEFHAQHQTLRDRHRTVWHDGSHTAVCSWLHLHSQQQPLINKTESPGAFTDLRRLSPFAW
jgi:hypothetical protein